MRVPGALAEVQGFIGDPDGGTPEHTAILLDGPAKEQQPVQSNWEGPVQDKWIRNQFGNFSVRLDTAVGRFCVNTDEQAIDSHHNN